MVPLYAARVEDLGLGDFVKIECVCGHVEMLTTAMLATARLAPHQKLIGLQDRLRCRQCDAKGKAIVSIVWAT